MSRAVWQCRISDIAPPLTESIHVECGPVSILYALIVVTYIDPSSPLGSLERDCLLIRPTTVFNPAPCCRLSQSTVRFLSSNTVASRIILEKHQINHVRAAFCRDKVHRQLHAGSPSLPKGVELGSMSLCLNVLSAFHPAPSTVYACAPQARRSLKMNVGGMHTCKASRSPSSCTIGTLIAEPSSICTAYVEIRVFFDQQPDCKTTAPPS